MRVTIVKSSWIKEDGCRLDCSPYTDGGIVYWHKLNDSATSKCRLEELLEPGRKGNYKGKLLTRIYTDDESSSVPYLTTTGMLLRHFDFLPRLVNRIAQKDPLCFVSEQDILISAAGTIGNLSIVNKQMVGAFTSSDNIRLRVNGVKASPFYIFSFLRSKYGKTQLENGSYGSIIRHLSTDHVAKLIVPRMADIEMSVAQLMRSAFTKREEANALIINASDALDKLLTDSKLHRISGQIPFGVEIVGSSLVQKRMDAKFHSSLHKNVIDQLDGKSLDSYNVRVYEPKRFKRNEADNGTDFYGTGALMKAMPEPLYKIKTKDAKDYLIDGKTLLIPRSGQLSGIVGHVVLPVGKLTESAISEDAIRIICESEEDAAFIFICLRSEFSRRQLKSRTFGSSIPHLDVDNIKKVILPEVPVTIRNKVISDVLSAKRFYDESEREELQAIKLLEDFLDKEL
ncbi:restriction endonuclease subunit S [Vibrio fluvialis]|nr:restriction endonuclease subunit S [Vibrio fluvialis]